jgi:ribonuclease HI
MSKKKFYAVAVGRVPGVYGDWPAAEAQVKGFPGAKFKGFISAEEAKSWLANPLYANTSRKSPAKRVIQENEDLIATDTVVVYTDGGCINNPGPGGYAAIIIADGEEKEFSGGYALTTNNRMELMACIVALRELEGSDRPVLLHSDSSYVVNGIEKGWARSWRAKGWRKSDGQPALNADLWRELLLLTESLPVVFKWVKGHAGNLRNERCDTLATSAARGTDLAIDRGYEGTE